MTTITFALPTVAPLAGAPAGAAADAPATTTTTATTATTATPGAALALLRQVLGQFSDATAGQVVPEASLASLQVDSLTLAEMLFALEDQIGVALAEPTERPQTVADILCLIEPHLALLQARAAA